VSVLFLKPQPYGFCGETMKVMTVNVLRQICADNRDRAWIGQWEINVYRYGRKGLRGLNIDVSFT